MKELKEVLPGILMVKVPKGAKGFETSVQDDGIPCCTYWYKENLDPTVVCLPPGSWEIVCLVSECSEELKSLALSNGFTETDLIIKKIEG